ncbi:MAG: hypothetical protein R3B96_24960, partial [Pirellulaceae bacterium]
MGSLRWAITQANASGTHDTIEFNIGTGASGYVDPTPGSPGSGDEYWTISLITGLPSITDTVIIDGTTQTGYAAGVFLPVIIDGNNHTGFNIASAATGTVIRGLVVRDFNDDAIDIAADDVSIVGNFIGQFTSTGEDAGDAEANTFSGVRIYNADNVIVGGSTVADRNVISGNEFGVLLRGTSTNAVVSGNYIGLNATGTSLVGAANDYGVYFMESTAASTVGGATTAEGNVIAGVVHNAISTWTESNDGILIQHNSIGITADGLTLLDHNDGQGSAIFITGGGDSIQILDNVVAGARYAGIELNSGSWNEDVTIQGNRIGTDATGTLNWGVGETGILVEQANNTRIGGTAAGEGNIVAFSGKIDSQWGAGIAIQDGGLGNTIRGNSIYSNSIAGIDLSATVIDGVDANDAGDVDTGTNNFQNWAVLQSVAIANDGTFDYLIDTTTVAAGSYTIDFYASTELDGGVVEGKRLLGSVSGVLNGNSSLSGSLSGITLASAEYVTLVTTDSSGNSSEFSNYAVATDSDAGGATPSDAVLVATSGGGLSINEDGGNDTYLVADDSSALMGGLSAFTFEHQFSTTEAGAQAFVSYTRAGNDDEFKLVAQSNGDLIVSVGGQSLTLTAFDFQTLVDGTKHAVAFSWDNTSGAWALYVDGAEVDSGTGLATGQTLASGGALVIGNEQDAAEAEFNSSTAHHATLFDTRLFNDVRTAEEISASYRSSLPYDEASLIANWRFDA